MRKTKAYLVVLTMLVINLALYTAAPLLRIASGEPLSKYLATLLIWAGIVLLFAAIAIYLVHSGSINVGVHLAVATALYIAVLQWLIFPIAYGALKIFANRLLA